jgi:lipopolysaccharide export system permease protein
VPDTTAVVSLYCRGLRQAIALLAPKQAQAATLTPTSAVQVPSPSEEVALGEDQRVIASRMREASYMVEIQKKLAISAACVVFALVGVPVALRFPRGGVGLVIGMSLAVFTIYYVGLIGGEELGDRLIVSPFLAMWVPNIVFSLVGLLGLWVVRSQGSTARGGDWADLRDALLGWLPRRKPARGRA